MNKLSRARAIMVVDTLAATGLIIVVVATIAICVRQYTVLRAEQDTRRELRHAAENELHRLRAGLAPPARPTSAAPPGFEITLRTAVSPGAGTWLGFNRVSVLAQKKVTAVRSVSVELSEYVPASGGAR